MSEIDNKINELKDQWFFAMDAIAKQRIKLISINHEAERAISDSIQCDVNANDIGLMLKHFSTSRFKSNKVRDVMKALCKNFFTEDADWRKHVDCVGIVGEWGRSDNKNANRCRNVDTCISSEVSLSFTDSMSGRSFSVSIPVKENVWFDFANMQDRYYGKYVLRCMIDRNSTQLVDLSNLSNFSKKVVVVAVATNPKVIAKAIDKFMAGELDEQIKNVPTLDFTRVWRRFRIPKMNYDEDASPTDEVFKSFDECLDDLSYVNEFEDRELHLSELITD